MTYFVPFERPMPPKSVRHRTILTTLAGFGGHATSRQIAEYLNLTVNGVSKSLGVLGDHVVKDGEQWWLRGSSPFYTRGNGNGPQITN